MAPTFTHKANSIINSYLQDFHVSAVSLIYTGTPEDVHSDIKVIASQDGRELYHEM